LTDALLSLIGRDNSLFSEDLSQYGDEIKSIVESSRFLVIGGSGSIGSAVVREIFSRNPKVLHVVDISENNLAEVVRDIRSCMGYIDGEFKTLCLDCNSEEFNAFVAAQEGYDYILNFSALKHVRSEKDPYTLMRMIKVNIMGTVNTVNHAANCGASKYFCVSTDKASNPVNMMGASKRIMEMFLMRGSENVKVSSARFANVAFSDGSLPFSWKKRIEKHQPIAAPNDIRRYFVTDQEGALLCLLSAFFGENRDVFFPKLSDKLHLTTFQSIAEKYLTSLGYEPYPCETEDEARAKASELPSQGKWPCYFFESNTTGEKDFEEFYTDKEQVDWKRFHDAGVIKTEIAWDKDKLNHFSDTIARMLAAGRWQKTELVDLFNQTLDVFSHTEKFRYLDDRM